MKKATIKNFSLKEYEELQTSILNLSIRAESAEEKLEKIYRIIAKEIDKAIVTHDTSFKYSAVYIEDLLPVFDIDMNYIVEKIKDSNEGYQE